jgi:hypothetical protein
VSFSPDGDVSDVNWVGRPVRVRTRLTRRGRAALGLIAATAMAAGLTAGWRAVHGVAHGTEDARSERSGGQSEQAAVPAAAPATLPPALANLPDPGTRPLARARRVGLYLPAERFVMVGYHEASYPDALELHPLGKCTANFNATKFSPPAPSNGPDYIVMSSRGRGHPATSAVDVAVRPRETILSPVSGTVESVVSYRLYSTYTDMKITIIPVDNPVVRVVLLHVSNVHVRRGAVLVAGRTALGTVRLFPFDSQVNDYVGVGIPHVHIEVKEHGR